MQALRWLRHYLQLPWLSQPLALPELNFTAHSMKATLLSWALQVPGITDADRLRQGHHRRGSAELYSRDDVLGQFRTQAAVRDAVRSGVHFSIPLHRGGQRPVQPIQVPNETFCKAASEQPWSFFEFSGQIWVKVGFWQIQSLTHMLRALILRALLKGSIRSLQLASATFAWPAPLVQPCI